jgi:hypothetical protein
MNTRAGSSVALPRANGDETSSSSTQRSHDPAQGATRALTRTPKDETARCSLRCETEAREKTRGEHPKA